MEAMLKKVTATVECATGLSLYPTYSYYRVYKRGDVLPMHRDRPSCEISVSLCLGGVFEKPWPLWLMVGDYKIAATLGKGDAMIYRGCE